MPSLREHLERLNDERGEKIIAASGKVRRLIEEIGLSDSDAASLFHSLCYTYTAKALGGIGSVSADGPSWKPKP